MFEIRSYTSRLKSYSQYEADDLGVAMDLADKLYKETKNTIYVYEFTGERFESWIYAYDYMVYSIGPVTKEDRVIREKNRNYYHNWANQPLEWECV